MLNFAGAGTSFYTEKPIALSIFSGSVSFNYVFVNLFGCQGESSSQMVRLLKILSGPKIYHLRHINVHFIFLSDLCFFEKGDPIHSCKRFNICFVLTLSLSFYEEVKERAVLKW